MPSIKLIFITTLLLLSAGCDNQDNSLLPVADDYQRLEADWLTHEEATLRKLTLSNVEYHIQLDITKSNKYTGFVEILFDYHPSKFPLTIDFVAGAAENIRVNNAPISIDYNGNFINVPSKHLENGRNTIKIQYSHAYSNNGSGFYRYNDASDDRTYLYTHFEPYDANKLFPSFDQPNLRATFELKVTAPKQWTVVTSVRETKAQIDGPYKRWFFPKSANFSTYIFPLHAGPWHIWEGKANKTPIRLMTRQSLAKDIDVREWFRITQQGFKFFEEYFDAPYPFTKYDQLLVPDFNIGGMENVGAVTFTERYIPKGKATKAQKRAIANTILHELSHMWFGDLVTIDWWSGLWLKESFASYMAPLALSEATEYKNAWRAFYSRTKQSAYEADQLVTTHAIDMPVADTKSGDASFDRITYHKGAAVLLQLSHLLGKEKFRDGIRVYLKDNAFKAAKLSDFFDALKKSSGHELQSWTYNWLNLAGVNTLKSNYQCQGGKITKFKLIQSYDENYPYLRKHKIQVGLYHKNNQDDLVVKKLVQVEVQGATTHVKQLIGSDCPLIVYPNHGDWGYVKVELDQKSLLMLPDNINAVKNLLLRSMLWQTLWDMVVDLKMPLNDYLELVLINISLETDGEILEQLLSNVSKAHFWVSSGISSRSAKNKQAEENLDKLELLMLQESEIAKDGSDIQKIWFKHFINIAHTSQAQNHISNWLQGKDIPLALSSDQDLRWQAVLKLTASAHPAAEVLLKLETTVDDSSHGVMMALAANASQPSVTVKQYWLDELMRNEQRQSAAKLKMAMQHLFPKGQNKLHGQFAVKILTDLHYLDSQRGQTLIEKLVATILPKLCTEASVEQLRMAQDNMQNLGLIAQKGLRIAHQQDALCVAINASID